MSELKKIISEAEYIIVAGHLRPDGDCVGACVALYHFIRNNFPGKSVKVYLETLPDRFASLDPKHNIISDYLSEKTCDLFIVVDCSSSDRLGDAEPAFLKAKHTLCIDHHISNQNYADESIVVPETSSTCEVLFELMGEDALVPEIAAALYVGIICDSGVFRYSNTTARTLEIAGKLIQTGIPFSDLVDHCVLERTFNQTRMLGRALYASKLLLEGRCIVAMITKQMMEFYAAKPEDTEGIIEELRVTSGTEVAVLLHEMDEREYKVSIRSNDFIDASQIATYFSGGGHKKAAGFHIRGSLTDVVFKITERIQRQM